MFSTYILKNPDSLNFLFCNFYVVFLSWFLYEDNKFLTMFFNQVKQELALNHALYKSSRRLSGLVSSCLQELSFPWYLFVGEMSLFELFLNFIASRWF